VSESDDRPLSLTSTEVNSTGHDSAF